MDLSKIIIVPKRTKLELDMYLLGLNQEQVIEKYKKENVNIERIIRSHENQKANLDRLKKYFDDEQFYRRENFTKDIADKAELIISFGGDNHFQYVSHFVNSNILMGINSDPKSSEGALTYFNADHLEDIITKLKKDNFEVEEWVRLEVKLGNETYLATAEVFLGEDRRKMMSRYILELNGKKEEQKSSGLLVVTGAGSTGWYDSSCRYIYENGNPFSKTSDYARFLATETYRGKLNGYKMIEGSLEKEQEIKLYSLADDKGIITIDCNEDYDFSMGKTALIKVSDKPLRVLKN